MSTVVVSFVPLRPDFEVATELVSKIEAHLSERYAGAREIQVNRAYEKPFFIDAGENHESIRCPSCGAEISAADWQDSMNACWDESCRGFDLKPFRFQCCGNECTPDRLRYSPYQGFAKASFEVTDPTIDDHEETEMFVAETLGTEVRTINARY